MRGSEPMPRRTCSMSAPSRSARLASSFMKEMRVASMAVGGVLGELGRAHVHDEQPLVIALERRIQRAHQLGRALVVAADDDAVRAHEVLDRRAFLEELGVGDDAEGDVDAARASSSSAIASRTRSAVPTGTVDLSTTTRYSFMWRPMLRAAATTCFRSAEPSSSGGVPTAMNWISPKPRRRSTSEVKLQPPGGAVARDQLRAGPARRSAPRRARASRSWPRRRRGTGRRCRRRRSRCRSPGPRSRCR